MAKRFIGGGDSDVAPAGSVQAFAGAEAPYGWLLCQGQELNIEDYPKLYEAIGSTWNTQVNPTSGSAYSAPAAGKFRLPDFRGSFLRGAGSPHAGDTCTLGGHQSQKTARNGLTGTFASSSHSHGSGSLHSDIAIYNSEITFRAVPGDPYNFSANLAKPLSGNVGGDSGTKTRTVSVSGSTSGNSTTASIPVGDNETRPLNQGVQYIIKE